MTRSLAAAAIPSLLLLAFPALCAAQQCDEPAYIQAVETCSNPMSARAACDSVKGSFLGKCRTDYRALMDDLARCPDCGRISAYYLKIESIAKKTTFLRGLQFPPDAPGPLGSLTPEEPWATDALFSRASSQGMQQALELIKEREGKNHSDATTVDNKGRDLTGPLKEPIVEDGGKLAPAMLDEAARQTIQSGNAPQAEQLLDRSLQYDPDKALTYSLRSQARLSQGRGREAMQDAQTALRLDPGDKLARETLSYIKSLDRPIEMRKGLTKPDFGALKTEEGAALTGGLSKPSSSSPAQARPFPGLPSGQALALLRSAEAKSKLGDLSGAILDLSRALEADRGSSRLWSGRAFLLNKAKNYKAALSDADEALRLDPADAQALRERGYARYQLGDYQGALVDLDKAISLDPRSALGHYYRAQVMERLGRVREALADYAAAAALDPALETLVQEAVARLSPAASAPSVRLAMDPRKGLLWAGMLLAAAALLAFGLRRAVRPGGATTAPPEPAAPAPAAGLAGLGTLAQGSVLAGAYRVTRLLGRGGMGVVYEALDINLERTVAIKQLDRRACGEPQFRERFLKEAQTAAKLKHPNLARIYSAVDEGGELFLVFEYVDGQPLEKLIGLNGRLPLEQAKRVVRDVCAALECAHGQLIIHRDLKPGNVMLAKDGTCKVLDFGIAHQARGAQATQTAAWGTPPYMAPEQEMGRVCKESDLYALGVMTYEMLTGTRPFTGGAYLLDKKRAKDYPPASQAAAGLPPETDAFFAKALEPDMEKRFRSAAEFAEAFAALGTAG